MGGWLLQPQHLFPRKLSWLAISSVQGIGNYLLPIGQWPFGWFSRAWRQTAESTKGKKKEVAERQKFWWCFLLSQSSTFPPILLTNAGWAATLQLPLNIPPLWLGTFFLLNATCSHNHHPKSFLIKRGKKKDFHSLWFWEVSKIKHLIIWLKKFILRWENEV